MKFAVQNVKSHRAFAYQQQDGQCVIFGYAMMLLQTT